MLIFLIGYMGCGKSTIGRKLSSKLEWDLVDTDRMIETMEGCSVAEIFDQHGEEYFRGMERKVLRLLIEDGRNLIVSTGGGLPMWGDNMDVMNSAGETVYLYRSAENIASRLSPRGREKRPKLRGLNDEELVAYMSENIALRDATYRGAKLTIDAVPLADKEIRNEIISHIKRCCRGE